MNAPSRVGVYGGLAKFSAVEIPVWAGLIAQYLEHRGRGYDVEILDCEVEGWDVERSAAELAHRSPDLAVFPVYGQQPSASTQCMPAAEAVAERSGCRTVCLGTHPSALPARTLWEGPWTYVAAGEGLLTVAGLLDVLEGMGGLADVPGLWWRDRAEIRGNLAPARNTESLDVTLGDRGFGRFDFSRYRAHNWHAFGRDRSPYASLQTSIGCPFRCTFCCINAPFGGAGIRYWSPENVLRAFDELADAGVVNVKVPDEMFVLNPQHVEAICDGLIERDYGFSLWAYARVDTVKDRLLAKLKDAGFDWLGLGIESGSKHVRDQVQKGRFGEADIVSTVGRIREHGIAVAANYIFGLPDDDAASMQATLDLACELNTEWANFYCAMAYPGSPLYAMAKEKGWRLPDSDGGPGWIGYSQHAPECLPLPTEKLRAGEVLRFRDEAFTRYFTRPEYLAMLEAKFGLAAGNDVRVMTAHRLERKFYDA